VDRREPRTWTLVAPADDLAPMTSASGPDAGPGQRKQEEPCSGSRGRQPLAKVAAEEVELVPQQVLFGGVVADPVRGTG
jgi:hypothetical protein